MHISFAPCTQSLSKTRRGVHIHNPPSLLCAPPCVSCRKRMHEICMHTNVKCWPEFRSSYGLQADSDLDSETETDSELLPVRQRDNLMQLLSPITNRTTSHWLAPLALACVCVCVNVCCTMCVNWPCSIVGCQRICYHFGQLARHRPELWNTTWMWVSSWTRLNISQTFKATVNIETYLNLSCNNKKQNQYSFFYL